MSVLHAKTEAGGVLVRAPFLSEFVTIPDGPRFSVFQLPTIWKFSVNKERN